MQQTASELHQEQTLLSLEHKVAPLKEVFRLQNADELRESEKMYLPVSDA
jgi:phosphoenolpyruvate phosphomutase